MEAWVRRLAVLATIVMFIVLIMGSTVTNTGSADGCGRSWPLCHGKFVPAYTVKTAIELSHRAVTGVETFLILGTAAGALWYRRRQRGVKVFSGLMVGTLFLQAGMGAAAVMWPQKPVVLATHFGISLACFASVFLVTRLLYQPFQSLGRYGAVGEKPVFPAWFRYATWGALGASIGVSYLGAYTRHSGDEIACSTWPGCNGQVYPGFAGPEGIAFAHRVAAGLCMALVAALAVSAYRRRGADPAMFRAMGAALLFIGMQALIGGAVVLTRLELWSTLAHSGMMALLFIALADACRQVMPRREPSPLPRMALARAPGSAD